MTSVARLHLFGAPVLLDGCGVPVRLRSAKQLGALVYLALEGRDQPVSRGRLVDLLWNAVPPERGRHSLAQACSAIRGVLGPAALGRTNGALRLEAPLETDLDVIAGEFDQLPLTDPLREAEWWAGPEFAHWVDGARGRLRRSANESVRRAVADLRRQGQIARVHAAAAVLYQLDPLSDTAVHALAERELIAGDVVGAIRLLRAHLARVQEALGCAPHRNVERLLRRLEAGSHPPVELMPARLAAEASSLRSSVFVGRERELSLLEAEWQRTGEGGFRSCLILGPAGIGKSSLVRRFAATVAARAQPIFFVTCQEIGEGIPFAGLADLVSALSRDPTVSGTDPTWLAEVARVHPALRLRYPGIPDAPEAPPESIRLRVAEGLLHVLDAVSDGTKIGIVFDDLPFMDPATRDVLHVLARRLSDRPVFLLATARTPELLNSSAQVFPGSLLVTWNTSMRLVALTTASIRALASALSPQLAGEQAVLKRIEQLSDGNPHFTEMLVADWEGHATASLAGGRPADALPEDWQPPDSLRQAFAHIYAELGDEAQQVVHVLAVAGRSLRMDELSTSVMRNVSRPDNAVFELLRRGILRLDDGSLSFKNELHRAYAYYAISADLRRFYHSRLGADLLKRDGENYMSRFEAARHLGKAGLHAEAADAVLSAARLAIENGAPTEAEFALRSVLANNSAEGIAPHLNLALADSLSAQGRYAETLKALEEVAIDAFSPPTRAITAFLRAQALQRIRQSDDQTIREAAQHALTLAAESGQDRVLAATAQIVAEAASEIWIPEMLAEAAEQAGRLEQSSRSDATRARALLTIGFCQFASGHFEEAVGRFSESARRLRANRLDSDLMRALNGEGLCSMAVGRYQDALLSYAAAAKVALKMNDLGQCSGILTNIGCAYEEVGMFAESDLCHKCSIEVSQEENPRNAVTALVNVAQVALIRGDFDHAMSTLVDARRASVKSQSWRFSALVDFSQADVFLAIGEPERAWPIVSRAASSTWGKERSLDTNGKQLRLALHLGLVNGGQSKLTSMLGELADSPRPLRLAHLMEVGGFLAWAVRLGKLEFDYVRRCGFDLPLDRLRGPLALLAAVGVPPKQQWQCRSGESAVDMIGRVFPESWAGILPPLRHILPEVVRGSSAMPSERLAESERHGQTPAQP